MIASKTIVNRTTPEKSKKVPILLLCFCENSKTEQPRIMDSKPSCLHKYADAADAPHRITIFILLVFIKSIIAKKHNA